MKSFGSFKFYQNVNKYILNTAEVGSQSSKSVFQSSQKAGEEVKKIKKIIRIIKIAH